MADRGCDKVTIWKTTEPGDMNTFGVTDRYLGFNYRGPHWDQSVINPNHRMRALFNSRQAAAGLKLGGRRLEVR